MIVNKQLSRLMYGPLFLFAFLPITSKMHTHTATLLAIVSSVPQVCIGPPEAGRSLRESWGLSPFHAVGSTPSLPVCRWFVLPSLSSSTKYVWLRCYIFLVTCVQAQPLISNVRTRQMVLILSCVYRSLFRSSTRWLKSHACVWFGLDAPGFSPIAFTPASTLGAVRLSPIAFVAWFLRA